MAGVTLDEITKVYDNGFRAVTELSVEIDDGEFLVLVGPSGCGKSTALRMIAGLEEITAGTLRIGDRVVNRVAPKDRDIAMVFQNYALYPHMTVYDNIAFALKLAKVSREEIDRRVREAADVLELGAFLNRKPGQLSGGQRQRVAMGRAIVRQPAAFLMDEPLSNLDAKLRVQMRAEIARIQRDLGVTTIYVTHDQVEAMTMADRVAVMRDGFLQQVAKPQDLYDDPVNLFVAAFIGSPAMNLYEGTIAADGGTVRLQLGSQSLAVADSVTAARPALRGYDGQKVIAGIRPEDLEDVATVPEHPADARLRANVELVEALGSELVVHFWVDAPPAQSGDPDAIEMLDLHAHEGPGSLSVGRFSARSGVKLAQSVEVAVDTERLYFFDPASGGAIAG